MDHPDPGPVRDDAYHITAKANVASIAAYGFRVDRRGVLGVGAYFDLGTEWTGWKPARERYPNQSLVVFRCEVWLGRVLDLDDDETRSRFKRFQRELLRKVGREELLRLGQGGQIDEFRGTLREEGEIYDTVQRTFVTDGQTRIAVLDQSRISVL
jgi:hypothetical protein